VPDQNSVARRVLSRAVAVVPRALVQSDSGVVRRIVLVLIRVAPLSCR